MHVLKDANAHDLGQLSKGSRGLSLTNGDGIKIYNERGEFGAKAHVTGDGILAEFGSEGCYAISPARARACANE